MREGTPLKGYLMTGHWSDIGTPEAYRSANRWMLENLEETMITGSLSSSGARLTGKLEIGANVRIGNGSSIVGPTVIGENTTIGDNVLIGPYTSIGSNCVIRDNAKILSSYIYDGVCVGRDTNVTGSIVDNDTTIGDGCTIETGTVVGQRTVIKSDVVVHSNVRLWPELVIPAGSVIKEDLHNEAYETST